eukprot:CAMPEP_0171828522 /NCGR_PEP_ID=MMETSP0992-20121227/7218_1 /TAXON_ID=483369 /ORGANISM="non described non described, Strain CCMP2098" /LENGTH=134 /DNA_ID=CAMNT_0012443731 /DNA_START=29 /DNA_END=433 /DNA_ORIENTATION=-
MSVVGVKQPPRPTEVHSIPCSIDHDGPANVNSFFLVEDATPEEMTLSEAPLRAHFRGRFLEGEFVRLPEGCEGVCTSPGCAPMVDGQPLVVDRFHEVRSTFEGATVWQHDRQKGTDDPLHRALAWVELAAAIHD